MTSTPKFRSPTQRDVFRAAVKAGWTWWMNGEGHITIQSPEGVRVTLSTTANDKGRQAANLKAMARRAGLGGKR